MLELMASTSWRKASKSWKDMTKSFPEDDMNNNTSGVLETISKALNMYMVLKTNLED